ncbi:DUF2799 domain-containing protein [Oceanospirillum beijerinckii]|uniref:DUF2799 domain-containing protein n=1 Tax=Oceanospirillum beijerinckii TaxID=64976 RepID=UPI00041D15D3|nr:DUF2799 domain-containing protein [Oceanospirillum beijerinckii]
MNKEECLSADWIMIGLKDGEQGRLLSQVGEYGKQCGEYGVTPDQERYASGREEGLKVYCTEASGFNQGKRGYEYKGVCSPENRDEFMSGYKIGQKYYETQSEISTLESQISSNDSDIERDAERIQKLSLQVQQGSDSAQVKQDMMTKILNLNSKNTQRETENIRLREQLAVKKYQYQQLKVEYGYQ